MNNNKKIRRILLMALVIYLGFLLYFTMFAESMGRVYQDQRYNLVPFTEIRRFIVHRDLIGLKGVALNLVGNVLVFIPLGMLLSACFKRCAGLGGTIAIGLLISFLIECSQLVMRVGSFDVDDLLLNTLGAALGHLILGAALRLRKKKPVNIRKI